MMDAGGIKYSVEIETQRTLSAQEKLDDGFDKLQREMDRTDKSASSLSKGMNRLAASIAAAVSAAALRSMADLVQSYQEMAERVKMATSSQEEYEMVQKRLLDTANGTYRSLAEAQELYIRTADSLRSMGYSTAQALDVTDSMSYAFVTNATSAERASAAISAFSKSMNTGRVAADQWETITSAIPSVIDDIAEASGRSAAEVRRLGAAGKLTGKDLSEGLRQSLDETAAAAGAMSNNLRDAGVRATNALQTMLVALEDQTGALDTLTNGIIQASEAVLTFAGDGNNIAAVLKAIELAAVSTAAVIAGRLLMSMKESAASFYMNTIAARAKAAADLETARTGAIAAAQNLVQARAAERAAVGLSTHAAAAKALATAEAQATAATTALTAAQSRMASVATVATTAMGALRGVMAFLGGPAGLVLLAAGALLTFASNAETAADKADLLTKSTKDLTKAQADLMRLNLQKGLSAQEKEARRLATAVEIAEARMKQMPHGQEAWRQTLITNRAALEDAQKAVNDYKKKLDELEESTKKKPEDPVKTVDPAAPTTTEDGQKRLKQMQDELELLKVTGEARARLAAIQRLGAEATDEERAEAERLASEIYRLEESQKAAKGGRKKLTDEQREAIKTEEELKRATQANADVLANLQEAIYQTSLSAEELAMRKAELALNEYATPEEVARVRELAAELYKLEEIENRRAAFTGRDGSGDVASQIRGNVSPLSGGKFDDQTARYEAEAEAEKQRYAEALERLKEAKELELEVKGGYAALEEQMYQEHIDRMNQIDTARKEMQLQEWAAGFDQMSNDIAEFAEVFASENKAMFQASKAAAIASTIIKTYESAQNAFTSMSTIPYVGVALGAAAAAAAVGAGMARVAKIRSQSMPGKALGGPVQAQQMYRVNENGPEIFNAANGRQYMIPNQRGDVVSNREARRDATNERDLRANVTVNQNITVSGKIDRYTSSQLAGQSAQKQRVSMSRFGK